MKKLSVIIPTLQKNTDLLNNLIKTLDRDTSVSEIILIDNSCKGVNFKVEKLRLIMPKENLFVNPSWNLAVEEAKEEYIAILNDDITIPDDFCKDVIENMNENMGIVGFHRDFVENIPQVMPQPLKSQLTLEKTNGRCEFFGVAMFFPRTAYIKIPDDIKIFFGDDWIFCQCKKNHRQNYLISNQKIYHYGSLSSNDKKLNLYSENDGKLYRKYIRKWYNYIFNIECLFKGFRITIFGIEISHHYDNKH